VAGILLVLASAPGGAAVFYADPVAGDDDGPGTAREPFRSVARAVRALEAGDELRLRDGIYWESGVRIDARGAADAPIRIGAAEGAHPRIDGGLREYRTPGNDDWEPADPERHIYRSKIRHPKLSTVHGYMEHDGQRYRLVPYESWEAFRSDDEHFEDDLPIYVGQGVYWNPADERIYVRLQPGVLQVLQQNGNPQPPALDAREVALFLYGDGEVLEIDGDAAHLVLEGLSIVHQNNAIEIASGAHDITVRQSELLGGRTHVIARGGAHRLRFETVTIEDAVPPWIAWQDVKSGTKPAHLLQGSAFNLQDDVHHVEISESVIRDTFDGIDATDEAHHLFVHHNLFEGIRDDCLQLGSGGYEHHVHHNRMLRVSKGVSRHGSGSSPRPGTTYVHHNVIDASTLMQYGRRDADGDWHGKALRGGSEGRVWASPFGSHEDDGFGDGDAWKIHHNTVIFGRDISNQGGGHTRPRRDGVVHEVYNNVFVQVTGYRVAREATARGGMQIYDGNLYHRRVADPDESLFADFEPFDGGPGQDFPDLAAFGASAFQKGTRASHPPGWEASGIEADPRLGPDHRPAPDGPAATGAVPLPPGMPGDAHEKFRGALAPEPAEGELGRPGRPWVVDP